MKHPACETCIWWCGSTKVKGITLDWQSGECRRRAPQGSGAANWPITDPDDFCGEHQATWPMYLMHGEQTDEEA